ncbi:MAG: HNH endonuclease signature motif containing protein [Burkholderiales bacterium]
MARPFDFHVGPKREARLRQEGRCALCGDVLDDLEEHAHHVIPNQSGDPRNPAHRWIATAENCVILCDMCHERVHADGRYRRGAVAPPSYYPHSHGSKASAHSAWAMVLDRRAKALWGR